MALSGGDHLTVTGTGEVKQRPLANQVQEYKFRLPTMNDEFKPGHRIMVPIQSSLFPPNGRNLQTGVSNILFATPADYQEGAVTIGHGVDGKSAVLLPVVEGSTANNWSGFCTGHDE